MFRAGLVFCPAQTGMDRICTRAAIGRMDLDPGLSLVRVRMIPDCPPGNCSCWTGDIMSRCPDNNRGMMRMCKYWNIVTCGVTTKRSEEVTSTIIIRHICTPRHRGKKQPQFSLCGQTFSLLPAADQQLFLQPVLISNIHCSSSVTVATSCHYCTGGRREIP